jgi:hypothetical protein
MPKIYLTTFAQTLPVTWWLLPSITAASQMAGAAGLIAISKSLQG